MCVCVRARMCMWKNYQWSCFWAVLCLQRAAGQPESWASRGLRLTSTEAQGIPAFLQQDSNLHSAEGTPRIQLTDEGSLLLFASGLQSNIWGHIGWSTRAVKGVIGENPDSVIKNRESRNSALAKRQKLGHQKLISLLPLYFGVQERLWKTVASDFNFYMCNQPFNFYKKFNSHSHAKNSHEENVDQQAQCL